MNKCTAQLTLAIFLSYPLYCADPLDVIRKSTWKSDKALTDTWLQTNRPDVAKTGKYADTFGKMTISYTNDSATMTLDGKSRTQPHKFLGQTTREIAFSTHDFLLKREVIIVLEIDEDENGYWIYNSQFDIKEHFVPTK